jgi:hypothetical protein
MIGQVVRPTILTFWSVLLGMLFSLCVSFMKETQIGPRFAGRASLRGVQNISSSGFDRSMKWQGEINGEEQMVVRFSERPSLRCGSGLSEGRRVW